MQLQLSTEQIEIAVGAWLILGSIAYALRARRRRRRQVRQMLEMALQDPDPATRRAAVIVAVQHGLAKVSDLLVSATHHETDPFVLDGIAEAVVRNQWEPTEDRLMLELRLWAQRRIEDRGRRRAREPAPAEQRV